MTDDIDPVYSQEALGTDVCVCGHIRDVHLSWSAEVDCIGGNDTCCCDGFEKGEGSDV